MILKYPSLLDSYLFNHIFNVTLKSSHSLCQCNTWNKKKQFPFSFYFSWESPHGSIYSLAKDFDIWFKE